MLRHLVILFCHSILPICFVVSKRNMIYYIQCRNISIMESRCNNDVTTIKICGSSGRNSTITEEADKLYISQPSLTNAVHELEREMNIQIFNRTNKGISLSKEGEDFFGYARQVLEQAAILEDKYKGSDGGKKQFCVSTQHYSFAVNAFVDLIKEYGQDEYDFSLREHRLMRLLKM